MGRACPGYPHGSAHRMFVSAARAKALCLQNGPPISAASLKRCRVDSRDTPGSQSGGGHDDKAETNSKPIRASPRTPSAGRAAARQRTRRSFWPPSLNANGVSCVDPAGLIQLHFSGKSTCFGSISPQAGLRAGFVEPCVRRPRRNVRERVILRGIFRIVAVGVELVNALRRTQIHSL
jgi:hypothetical protein